MEVTVRIYGSGNDTSGLDCGAGLAPNRLFAE
jgi:hypothetical protein